MKNKQVTFTIEEVKQKIVDYTEAMDVAYSVRDGNLYMMYKDLRDTFMLRYSDMLTEKQRCSTKNSKK